MGGGKFWGQFRKIQRGGGLYGKSLPWGVWIFSGTTPIIRFYRKQAVREIDTQDLDPRNPFQSEERIAL